MTFFQETYKLATKAKSTCRPNPAVGAIIVKNGTILGKGKTSPFGGPHAEVNAISDVKNKDLLINSEIYVTLMPCAHYGKTPPCTDAIIKNGIKKVHVANKDPNPLVMKNAMKVLKKANIKVLFDYPEDTKLKLFTLNEDFFYRIHFNKPWILVKYAMTLDGKIATFTNDSKWISNEKSRNYVAKLRASCDGILVGTNTCLKDNPSLTIRLKNYKGPELLRVIPDFNQKLTNQKLNIFNQQAPTIILGKEKTQQQNFLISQKKKSPKFFPKSEKYPNLFLQIKTNEKHPSLKRTFKELLQNFELNSLFIEGGSQILGSLFTENLINKVHVFIAPKLLGDGKNGLSPINGNKKITSMKSAFELKDISRQNFENDTLISGYLHTKEINELKEIVL